MKKLILIALALFTLCNADAQKYFTKTGKINFAAGSAIEKIEADNSKATSVIDVATGAIEWSVLMKGFTFEKALMQEHFNENYVESTKFPKAVFKGKIANIGAVQLSKDGVYPAEISGTLEMHGQTKPVKSKANFTVKGGKITASSTFKVLLADYKIDIPALVKDKISKEAAISVEANYQLLK
jgi:polyisoprenoid-binding protein YceI